MKAESMIPPGYKKTDFGVIPGEWDVRNLAEICSKITDGTHDTPTPVRSGVPFLTAIHIKENFIDYGACLFLTKEDHRIIFARCNPMRGDVLMVNIGAGVATTAFVDVDFEFSLKNVALLKPSGSLASGRYLNQCLIQRRSSITQALSSGGAQPFLSLSQIGQIDIPVPPISEQRAIAEALGDVDGLLGALDRLIAKKRDLKQATMQQLLTPPVPGGVCETRLPGFHGEWEIRRLGDVAVLKHGYAFASESYRPLGAFKVITIANVQDGFMDSLNCSTVMSEPIDMQAHHRLSVGDILISMTGNVGRVCRVTEANCLLNQRVGKLIPQGIDGAFLFMLLRQPQFTTKMTSVAKGGAQPNLSASDICDYALNFPKATTEQTAIAEVLSDMDAELTALEQRREKTRALKQAMMQELLTGRTRLV